MNILITCQYYWPDNFLINEIAEELVKKGNKVTVLTGLPDYTTTKIPKKYKLGRNRHEFNNGVEIIRVPIIARHHGFFMRVLNYLSYFITSSFYAITHKFDKFDIIYAYQLAPVLMVNPGILIKKKYNIPMFLYVLDLWPDQMKIWNIKEKNPIYKIMLRYCKKAYNSGDKVGITSKPFKDYLINVCNVDEKKIIYLPQHSSSMNTKNIKKNKSQITNFIFAGNIGQQQNIECIIKAVSLMKTTKPFIVNIYGEGTSYKNCVEYSKKLKVEDKIKFYGRVPKEQLNDIYPKMDAFLLTLCSEKEIGFVAYTVPAKLQNYMSGGKPILAAVDGGAKEIIEESKCGAVVSSGDYKAYAKLLDDFVNDKEKYQECGKNAVKYFIENFEKDIVIDKLEKELIKLVDSKKLEGVNK